MQVAASLSQWVEQVTQPEHPYYHPIQSILFGGCAYIGTACLTSISPKKGMLLAVLAYNINQLVAPIFARLFNPYENISLAPLIGQVLQISITVLLSKIICGIIQQPLALKEIRNISFAFLATLFVFRFAIRKLRQEIVF